MGTVSCTPRYVDERALYAKGLRKGLIKNHQVNSAMYKVRPHKPEADSFTSSFLRNLQPFIAEVVGKEDLSISRIRTSVPQESSCESSETKQHVRLFAKYNANKRCDTQKTIVNQHQFYSLPNNRTKGLCKSMPSQIVQVHQHIKESTY